MLFLKRISKMLSNSFINVYESGFDKTLKVVHLKEDLNMLFRYPDNLIEMHKLKLYSRLFYNLKRIIIFENIAEIAG